MKASGAGRLRPAPVFCAGLRGERRAGGGTRQTGFDTPTFGRLLSMKLYIFQKPIILTSS
jgi:hypothetical protein